MKRIADLYFGLLSALAVALAGGLLVPVLLQIVTRYTDVLPTLMWTEEAARFCLVWMVMVGAALAVRLGMHFDIDLLPTPKTPAGLAAGRLLVDGLIAAFAALFFWVAAVYAFDARTERSEITELPMIWMYIAFPVTALGWLLFLAERITGHLRVLRGGRP